MANYIFEEFDHSLLRIYRHVVTFFSERRFDVNVLPADTLRVYKELEGKYNEDYALTFVFIMRTAQELHRAWNMTLLTSMTLQRIKDKFNIRMTWTLGVVKLKVLHIYLCSCVFLFIKF